MDNVRDKACNSLPLILFALTLFGIFGCGKRDDNNASRDAGIVHDVGHLNDDNANENKGGDNDKCDESNVTLRASMFDAKVDVTVSRLHTSKDAVGIVLLDALCDNSATYLSVDSVGGVEFVLYDDGHATLRGTTIIVDDGCDGRYTNSTWNLDVAMKRSWTTSLRRELLRPHITQPTSITSTWYNFTITNARLIDIMENMSIAMTHRPSDGTLPAQLGVTANGVNLRRGFSALIYYDVDNYDETRLGLGELRFDVEIKCDDRTPVYVTH